MCIRDSSSHAGTGRGEGVPRVDSRNVSDTPSSLGSLLRNVRNQRGLSKQSIAQALNVGVRAIDQIEIGERNPDLSLLNRYASALMDPADNGKVPAVNLSITGPTKLSGSIVVRSSKNAAVALLCASLPNEGRTVLRGIARIDEAVSYTHLDVYKRQARASSSRCSRRWRRCQGRSSACSRRSRSRRAR